MKTNSSAVALALGMLFVGCGGSKPYRGASANSVFVQNGDVYVAGNEYYDRGGGVLPGSRATLWKNGAIQFQSDILDSEANSVFVSGADAYVAGTGHPDPHSSGIVLWANGFPQYVGVCKGSYDYHRVSSLFVAGEDVYVAGSDRSGEGYFDVAVLWKNGVPQYFYNGNFGYGCATSVFVSGEDVYVAGYVNKQGIIWKNGAMLCTTDFYPCSIFVSGEDIYVAGKHLFNKSMYLNSKIIAVVLQKNNELQVLSDDVVPDKFNTSVFVSGADVYVMGNDGYKVGYWKNGARHDLADNVSAESAYDDVYYADSIFVSGGDVYVAGRKGDDALLWKNGTVQVLPLK
jgi:hypothetical protein